MRLSAAFRRCPAALAGVLCVLGLTAAVATTSAVAAGGPCDVTATPETFALALEEATGGQTICLATGDYGIFHGTDKAVTITADGGSAPQMLVDFSAGDTGFVLDGMTGMGGLISDGATGITIRNSAFTSTIQISGANTRGIVLDANTHDWMADSAVTKGNAKI